MQDSWNILWEDSSIDFLQIFVQRSTSPVQIGEIDKSQMLVLYGYIYLLGGGNSNMFYFSPRKLGEDEPILTHIFQRGWNHQLV